MDKIINAGVRITRKCTMHCKYCNIGSIVKPDLSLEEWKKAFKIVKKLGVNELVLLGGEPTAYLEIVQLVNYLINELQMNVSITTNAFRNYDIIVELLNAGLTKLGFSIDNLDSNKSISQLKNFCGLETIKKIIENDIKYNKLVDYVVLSKNNANDVESLIKYMTSLGISSYILPFHHGNEGSFEHRKDNELYAFKKEDIDIYNYAIDKIIELKNDGYLIDNSIEFLENSKKYILNLNWKCNGLSELRIDSDGRMLCCCDKIGNVNLNFNIFDLANSDNLQSFFNMRNKDSKDCVGCLWPSSYEAEKRKKLQL